MNRMSAAATAPYIEAYPGMVIPIKALREAERLSLKQLSQRSGVNLQAIYLTECGCYTPPLPKLLDYFVEHCDSDRHWLQYEYEQFQAYKRKQTGEAYSLSSCTVEDLGVWTMQSSPVEVFRLHHFGVTRTALAKLLCIQPAVLYRLVQNLSASLPESVGLALKQSGLPVDLIEELDDRVRDFYGS